MNVFVVHTWPKNIVCGQKSDSDCWRFEIRKQILPVEIGVLVRFSLKSLFT